jgi:tripartite-type tricarboxylate transporter receptor subunit TctC
VDNRPGAATVVGTQFVAQAPADGYTSLVMANSFTINSSMWSNLPYDSNRGSQWGLAMTHSISPALEG